MPTENTNWFDAARYGMFLHWGPYAVAGRGEWLANRECVPFEEYREQYAANFRAEKYDPREWVQLAKDAGMGYLVLTTRHHDGFCLWDSQITEFNAVNYGAKRDLLQPYADAVREAGLKLGFYFSVADWYHPDYPEAYARDWALEWPDEVKRQRFVAYYQAQIEELMTRYGKVDYFWYDGCIPGPLDGEVINRKIKEWQPGILINERNGEPCDVGVSEQAIRAGEAGHKWEACLTLNDNWGYHAGDENWKNPLRVLQSLLQCAATGGNLLLNVGPHADGTIPEASAAILREAGAWLRRNGEFLSDSDRSPFTWSNWGRVTTKDSTVYLHIWNSTGTELCWPEIKNKVLSARYVATGEAVAFEQTPNSLRLRGLPVPLPDLPITTIALEVEGVPEALHEQKTGWIEPA